MMYSYPGDELLQKTLKIGYYDQFSQSNLIVLKLFPIQNYQYIVLKFVL